MIKVNSSVRMNMPAIRKLTEAATTALEMTAEHIHTEVVQAQVMPRDTGAMQGEKTFIKAGTSRVSAYKDGSEAVNSISKAINGKVTIATAAPQVRRLYFHPEYKFQKHENPHAKGKWFEDWMEGGKHEKEAVKAYAENYRRLTGV